jgi:hypothetical protein
VVAGPSLEVIGGEVSIRSNAALAKIDGLNELKSISGGASIIGNPVLTEINGLHSLASVSGDLNIYDNNNLKKLNGLDSLSSVYGSPMISSSALANLDELNALSFVIGPFIITNNTALENIHQLINLRRIEKGFNILGNSVLKNLDGLNGLTYVDDIYIADNPVLENLKGLSNLNPGGINSMSVFNNSALPACEAEILAERLGITCYLQEWDSSTICTGRCTCTGNNGTGSCN